MTTAGPVVSSPTIGREDRLHIACTDGTLYQTLTCDSRLYAVDSASGVIMWSVDLAYPGATVPGSASGDWQGDGWSEPVVGPDGTVYVAMDDPYLRAVDPNGTVRWITRLGDVGGLTLLVDAWNTVYAASEDGVLYAVDSDGEVAGRWVTDEWLGFPVITPDGGLIVSGARDRTAVDKPDHTNTVYRIGDPGCQDQSGISTSKED